MQNNEGGQTRNTIKQLREFARQGMWGPLRDALRTTYGFNLDPIVRANSIYNKKGKDLDSAWRFLLSGGSARAWNSANAMPDEDRRTRPGGAAAPNGPVANAGPSPAPPSAGAGAAAYDVDPFAVANVDYSPFQIMGGKVPGMVSVGSLMGRNPFGKGFGFDPIDYAKAIIAQKYDPQNVAITNQIKRERELGEAAPGRLNEIYDPYIEQEKRTVQERQGVDQSLAEKYAALATQMGADPSSASAGTAGYLLGEGQSNYRDLQGRVEEGVRTKSDTLAEFTAASDSRVRDLQDARLQLNSTRGDDYKAALIEGINQRMGLQTQAIANRGALFSQAMTQAMGGPTLATANIQAQMAMDELLRARQAGEINTNQFNLQLEQARRAGVIDDLTIQQMQQELAGGAGGPSADITKMAAGDLTNAWNYLVDNFTGLYGQWNEDTGTNGLPAGALLTADARDKLVSMARGMGIEGTDAQIADWVAQMAGGKTADQWRTGIIRGSGKGKTVPKPGAGKGKGSKGGKVYTDKNGRRYRVGARGGRIYID